jgi:hypothetical protein
VSGYRGMILDNGRLGSDTHGMKAKEKD